MKADRKLSQSFKDAFSGLVQAYFDERNMRIHVACLYLALAAALLLEVSRLELILILVVSSLVMVSEMINTSLEKSLDAAAKDFSPTIRAVKHAAAGAVLVASAGAAAVGALIFWGRLPELPGRLSALAAEKPLHLAAGLAGALFLVLRIERGKRSVD